MNLRKKRIIYAAVLFAVLFAAAGAMGYGVALPAAPKNPEIIEEKGAELVVVVHGMGRTEMSMLPLAWTLERQGYDVINWGYSSTCCSVDELGQQLADHLHALDGPEPAKIHFVGHSLGNIIVRHVLDNNPPAPMGRVVMLAPPNDGSEIADKYVDWLGWLWEPLEDLTTDEDSTVRTLAPIADREVGVIAGKYDGKVTVEETRIASIKDHYVVPAAHTFIMNRPDVHHLTVSFLEDGTF